MRYCVFDLETSTGVLYKRKGSPFLPDNKIVMLGHKRADTEATAEDYPKAGWLVPLLKNTTVLVGFNLKFDLLHALRCPENLEAYMDWVANGGVTWCCQLAEYLLDGMQRDSHMLSLDEVAPRYGGKTKIDEVKALWEAGVATEDIDPDLLRRYLIGVRNEQTGKLEHGDIGNTEAVFLGQVKRASKAKQMRSLILNMGALACTVEMERNGMHVDKAKAMLQADALRVRLAEQVAAVQAYIPKDLPFEFNWNSRFHKSALIFGGEVKYKARAPKLDDDGNPTYRSKEVVEPVLDDDGQPVLFASGKNKGQPKTKKVKVPDLEQPVTTIQDFVYEFPGYAKPQKRWEGADEGVYSVAEDVIEELADQNVPFLKALGEMTKLAKDLNTYYVSEDGTKGMLTLVGDDGLVHHMLNMVNTVTARLSSSNPNLQNVNGEGEIKTAFTSRFEKGVMVQSDFTSLEVYGQALLTGDRQLIEDLLAGLDMHCKRLAQVEDVPYTSVVEWAKSKDAAKRKAEWVDKRGKIKVYSFQRAYGAGAAKIAGQLGLPVEVVEAWIEADDKMYPGIPLYYERLTADIRKSRKPTSRVIMHPDIKGARVQLGRGSYRTPDGKLYIYEEQPSPEYLAKRGTLSSFSPTEIRNYVVQGTGGEWMKATMWLLVREFYKRRNFGGLALLVNTVHDAAYVDSDRSVAAKAAHLLHACMEEASTFMEWYFKWPVPVATPAETSWGPNWKDEQLVPLNRNVLTGLKQTLRNTYMEGYTPSFPELGE